MSDAPKPSGNRPTEFLEQSVYRRRRLLDAIKLLPMLGGCLFLMPALILGDEGGATAARLVYFFFTWCALIGICAVLVRALSRSDEG